MHDVFGQPDPDEARRRNANTMPPDPVEGLMRARFAAPDTGLLERLTRENEELRRQLGGE
jgi:hypothetical protein